MIGNALGGGLGWLSRRYGYAADSVVRAEVVTADGESRTVSADRDPDLFWALRGAGANFGAVTGLEFRLYPVRTVHAGVATFPLDRSFLNWLHDPSRTHAAYTATDHARLRELKLASDPDNVFGLARNIPPAIRTAALLGA